MVGIWIRGASRLSLGLSLMNMESSSMADLISELLFSISLLLFISTSLVSFSSAISVLGSSRFLKKGRQISEFWILLQYNGGFRWIFQDHLLVKYSHLGREHVTSLGWTPIFFLFFFFGKKNKTFLFISPWWWPYIWPWSYLSAVILMLFKWNLIVCIYI